MINNWSAPQRPNAYAEQMLLAAILDGTFEPGSTLPGERTLANELGVTRPTLREAIQRLARDGWLTVRQGRPTVVNDYWRDGGLNVLNTLVHYHEHLPPTFVTNLLDVRLQLAPAYTRDAIARDPERIARYLEHHQKLSDTAAAFAAYDWQLHRQLAIVSNNPIYTLILNGFADFYEQLARVYFSSADSRQASRDFYTKLALAAEKRDAALAERICRTAMLDSTLLWERAPAALRGAKQDQAVAGNASKGGQE